MSAPMDTAGADAMDPAALHAALARFDAACAKVEGALEELGGGPSGDAYKRACTTGVRAFMDVKEASRKSYLEISKIQAVVGERRKVLDDQHLQLQNFQYREFRLSEEVKLCREFTCGQLERIEADEGASMARFLGGGAALDAQLAALAKRPCPTALPCYDDVRENRAVKAAVPPAELRSWAPYAPDRDPFASSAAAALEDAPPHRSYYKATFVHAPSKAAVAATVELSPEYPFRAPRWLLQRRDGGDAAPHDPRLKDAERELNALRRARRLRARPPRAHRPPPREHARGPRRRRRRRPHVRPHAPRPRPQAPAYDPRANAPA
ncbi:hypothetical protein JL720_5847 [Aureococcus anophagefferens]|nr:hypothetical protein JL720_5847 [Aureococcus anophagefferens]